MSKRILLTVLDWGLGHATRSIPIIHELIRQSHQVVLGSSGPALQLLRDEFPKLEYIELPAYSVRYPTHNMAINMLLQSPRILATIIREYLITQSVIRNQRIDVILSDSRFGCFSAKVHSVFISHQINIIVPKWSDKLINGMNRWFISRYKECWVPDNEEGIRLSGKLSFPVQELNVAFVGPLSRMSAFTVSNKIDIIAVLSGPEPQRSILEEKLVQQLKKLKSSSLIISGKPASGREVKVENNLKVIPFLSSEELNEQICAAKIVICRSGYSSIMDLAYLGKKAILIPTPGQTEQEYLAQYFEAQMVYHTQSQNDLDIEEALAHIDNYSGLHIPKNEALKGAVNRIGLL